MARAVFVDRDGVLNRTVLRNEQPVSPRAAADFEILPGVSAALQRMADAGFLLIVITNQPDIARGLMACAELERMHEQLRAATPVDAIYTCPHDDVDGCSCRKPKPGLLLRAAEERSIDLRASFLVGDSWKDIEAGVAAGCTTVLVDSAARQPNQLAPDYRARNLEAAAEIITGTIHPRDIERPQ